MRRLILLGGLGLVVAALVVAQLVLPGIAAQRIRDRLSLRGRVLSVSVQAFPAVELLWNQADSVDVRLAKYRSSASGLGGTVSQAGNVGTLNASAAELDTGLLTLRDATLSKRGSALRGSATVTEADLRRSVPVLQSVTPVASGGGRLVLRGVVNVLGALVSADAAVAAQNGAVVVAPNVPFGGLATIRVFANPNIDVQSVSATPSTGGFRVSAVGRLG
jgi:hypothetical protein